MKTIRNLALAGTVAIAAALSAGTASAAPVGLGTQIAATESAATPVYHGYGYGHYGHYRLCRLPFFVLVKRFGYFRAKMIKMRCY